MSIDKLGIKPWMKLELPRPNSEEEVIINEKEEHTEIAPEEKPITASIDDVLNAYNAFMVTNRNENDVDESSVVEIGGIKIDCSSLSPDGYIKGVGLSTQTNATQLLMSLKPQIKDFYKSQIENQIFDEAFNKAMLDAINNIDWIQESPNEPAKANVKDIVTDFLTRLTTALGEVKTDETPNENNVPKLVTEEEVEQLYKNLTSPTVADFNQLFTEVQKLYNNPEEQNKLVEKFLKEHGIVDVSPDDILLGFGEVADKVKNIGGIFAHEQAKLIELEKFTESILTPHQQRYAEIFLIQNRISSLTPEQLIEKIQKAKKEVSKIGGGMAASQARIIMLDNLTKELNEIAFSDLKEVLNDSINNSYSIFGDDYTNNSIENNYGNLTDDGTEQNTKQNQFAKLVSHKDEFKETLKGIFENDIYAETTIEVFTPREIDTFIDSVITQVVNANPDADEATLVAQVNAQLQEKLATDPLAPMSISQNLLNTDDYLLSDEEKAIKADMLNIEQDKDPEAINGDGIDYSVMPHAAVNVAQVSTDWDYMDMDTALNSKNIYGESSTNTTTANLYKNLEFLKPQLKEMIKAEFEAIGKEFDEAVVDKYLNYFMTEVVREAIQAKYHETLPDLYPNTVLPANATIEDLGKLLTTKVKEELAEGNDSFGTDWANNEIDPLLCATSDYFLSEEEKALKLQMENNKAGL